MEPNAAIAPSEFMNHNAEDIEISFHEWTGALCATQNGFINQLLSAALTAIERGGSATILKADERTPLHIIRDRIEFDGLLCEVNRARAAPEFSPADQVPSTAPCPNCGERENIDGEEHPGVAYIVCGKCKHRGPDVAPRRDMSRADKKKLFTAALCGWNEQSRQVDL